VPASLYHTSTAYRWPNESHRLVPHDRTELDNAGELADRVVHAGLSFSRHDDVAVPRRRSVQWHGLSVHAHVLIDCRAHRPLASSRKL
jgi:hypothetical protein